MPLTREWLQERRLELRLQIALNEGAIQMIDYCLAQLDAPSDTGDLSVQQFAEMVAGPGATAAVRQNGEK